MGLSKHTHLSEFGASQFLYKNYTCSQAKLLKQTNKIYKLLHIGLVQVAIKPLTRVS